MIRHLAFTAGFAFLSAVAFAPNAQAQTATEDVPFTGTVGSVCTFSATTAGTIVQPNPESRFLESTVALGGASGTAGKTTVNCSSGASLTTAAPTPVNVPTGFDPEREQTVVSNGTNVTSGGEPYDAGFWNRPASPITIPAATDVDLEVGMIAGTPGGRGPALPSGNYEYIVTLTATSN